MSGKLKELTVAQQAEADRKAALPKDPGEYKVEINSDFKLPEGSQLDEKSPGWAAFAGLAHKYGLPQEAFRELATLHLQDQFRERGVQKAAIDADFKAKMGDTAPVRIDAVMNGLKAAFGDDKAKAIGETFFRPEAVQAIEHYQKLLVDNGITVFNGSGREGSGRADGKPANWDSMSSIDRLTWVRSNQKSAA